MASHLPLDPSLPVIESPLAHGPGAAEWSRSHESLKDDPDLWDCLAFDGIQSDGRGGLIELRRCPACGSTIARPISKPEALALLGRFERICAASLESLKAAA